MSLLQKLTVKPLLWTVAAQALLLAGAGVLLMLQHSATSVARAERGEAQAERDARTTERDAWKARAEELAGATTSWQGLVDVLAVELKLAQREQRRLDSEGRAAIAAAQRDAVDAERTLKQFMDRHATESRKPDCARALAAVEATCPALEGY